MLLFAYFLVLVNLYDLFGNCGIYEDLLEFYLIKK